MREDPWKRFCDAMDKVHRSQQERRKELQRIEDQARKVVRSMIDKHEKGN